MKVAIVGGNIAGSLSAINLKCDVVIFEEHKSAGFPVSCAGLISEDCYEKLKEYGANADLNEIKGAFFFSPSGKHVEVVGKSKAVVVERKILDSQLLRRASKKAEVRINSKVVEVSESEVAFVKGGKISKESFDYIIGADGVNSTVAKSFGFERPKIFSALQILVEFEPVDEKFVELYFGKKYSDGFFAYAIPVDSDLARVGVVSRSDPKFYLKRLLNEHPSVSERVGKSVLELNAGAIPVGLVNFVKGNVTLVGDAAGMVKPYTGGGIYYSLVAAELLGEHFPDLKKFEKAYRRKMWREFYVGEKIRRLYDVLEDEDYDELVKIASDVDFSEIHMDRPSTLLKIILKNPKILKLAKFFFL